MATSGQIRSTKTYIWYTADVLGTGATSTVFKGRHKIAAMMSIRAISGSCHLLPLDKIISAVRLSKQQFDGIGQKTGLLVAVKAFNNISFLRPHAVQQREFDVLLKLNHKNIVKLYNIEDDQITKQPVIVMELCTGGSLYHMLDEPENCYGVNETEFKSVLRDVCEGMKHLRDQGVVHRDIKPGNIMRVLAEDGTYNYKLADFGAARELHDEENFMSLYGTEEYLHPDLYERAVLRQPIRRAFTARIDLWSIGVTFFHVATGVLPFRPHGGRKNRETMFYITTKKASGVISGVQRETVNGPIEWSNELPKTCRLSQGLRSRVTKLLQGLLECNPEHMWTFEQFFDCAHKILDMRVIDVFSVPTSQLLKVYVERRGTLAEYQEEIAKQTSIHASAQMIYWDNATFFPDASVKCESFPVTSTEKPMLLLDKSVVEFPKAVPPPQPKLPRVTTQYSLENDVPVAKMCSAVLNFNIAVVTIIALMQQLFKDAVKMLILVLKDQLKQLRLHVVELKATVVGVQHHLEGMSKSIPIDLVVTMSIHGDESVKALCNSIQLSWQEINDKKETSSHLMTQYLMAEGTLNSLHEDVITEDTLTKAWAEITSEYDKQDCKTCIGKFGVLNDEVRKIYIQFKRDKQAKSLSYNEEQIHKMDKEKLGVKSTTAISLCQSHCEERWKKNHKELSGWYRILCGFNVKVSTLEVKLAKLIEAYKRLEHLVQELDDTVQKRVSEFNRALHVELTRPKPEPPLIIQELIRRKPTAHEQVAAMEETSKLLVNLPLDTNGMIRVPKELKQCLVAWEKDVDRVAQELMESKELMSELSQLST